MPEITNLTRNITLAENIELADTPLKRMKGLLFRKTLEKSTALIIRPTSSIHTFFMQFPIDIVFLDKDNKILKLRRDVIPFRLISCPLSAKTTIEFPAGTLSSTQTQTGDFLSIQK